MRTVLPLLCMIPLLLGAEIHFSGTDHELEIIRLAGKRPGPTVLVFGGIHGDEPGAHFSSEYLVPTRLEKGNLIILPRVNFPGIMLNRRQLHGDMNRKFAGRQDPGDPDIKVMEILKVLMKEADVFVNQHDASGFHRDKHLSSLYSPHRYGQCLIVDTGRFYSEKLKQSVDLDAIGRRIVKRVNRQIKNPKYHFTFWNHNSVHKNTKHLEMRKSATYYALNTYSIPAFGLETSKNLPSLDIKVRHQILMLGEIFREFGLEFEFPDIKVKKPVLYWVELIKNGDELICINDNTNLRLNRSDTIRIRKIFANYDSGLSADILHWGTINDFNKKYTYQKPTTVLIKKNNFIIGRLFLKDFLKNSIQTIAVEINGRPAHIPNWGRVTIGYLDAFKILSAAPGTGFSFDLRGYQGQFGRDDKVIIYPVNLLRNYSFQQRGQVYFVKIFRDTAFAGGFQLSIRRLTFQPSGIGRSDLPLPLAEAWGATHAR